MAAEDRYEKNKRIFEEFRKLAMELKVSVICAQQAPRRGGYYYPYEGPKIDLVIIDYISMFE